MIRGGQPDSLIAQVKWGLGRAAVDICLVAGASESSSGNSPDSETPANERMSRRNGSIGLFQCHSAPDNQCKGREYHPSSTQRKTSAQ